MNDSAEQAMTDKKQTGDGVTYQNSDIISQTFLTSFPKPKILIEEGDSAIIYVNFGSTYAIQVERGKSLQMKYGTLRHEFLIGKPYGSRVSATAGYVYALKPSPSLWTRTLPRRTQILYTPDCALITSLLDLRPGSVVFESGTGSGSLSHAIAGTVAPNGRLFSFDIDAERVRIAAEQLTIHGFGDIVEVSERNVCESGFGVQDSADAIFLDLPHPWEVVEAAKTAMKKAVYARFCSFSPCIEQVQRTADALAKHGFLQIETVELVPRTYKVIENPIESLTPASAAVDDGAVVDAKRRRTDDDAAMEVGTEGGRKRRTADVANCKGKRYADGSRTLLTHIPFPVQQPTHTGYLISATLL